jgi:hypothetical protein
MFLGLGGSRRRAQAQGNGSQGSAVLLQEFVQAGLQGAVAEDPLQALATGKYAPSSTRVSAGGLGSYQESLARSKSLRDSDPMASYQQSLILSKSLCEDPMAAPFGGLRGAGSPRSTLPSSYAPSPNLSRETSRGSGDSGVSSEEAMSRDCSRFEPAGSRQSQALALAKKLKNSLGSKFADSLRETIKEVVKREKVDGEGDAWPQLLEDVATTTTSRSESSLVGKPWDACWPVEETNTGNATAPDHSSLLSFPSAEHLTTPDAPARAEIFTGSAEQSKPSSWLSQENLTSQAAMAELSCTPWDAAPAISSASSSMDNHFFTPAGRSSLLGRTPDGDMSLGAVLKESSAKGQWMDGLSSSRPAGTRPAVTRRHFFPEAAAMGTSRPDSVLRKPNFQPREEPFPRHSAINKDQSLLDVLKGFQSSGKDCGSFLEFLNPGHPSNQALREDARQRLYGKSDSCQDSVRKADWRGSVSTSYTGAPLLELPESSGALGYDGGVKRTTLDGVSSGSGQLSKRQCMGSSSVLLDALPVVDAGGGVKSEGRFKDYLANLTARESSYELPGSSLADLLEDLSQDLL